MVDPGRVSTRIAPVDETEGNEDSTDSVDTPSQPQEQGGPAESEA
ncbi:hypothetical protein ACIRYZ_39225 [Kitasatospora sp. NPDC101155]|jgi:hypothetical protein